MRVGPAAAQRQQQQHQDDALSAAFGSAYQPLHNPSYGAAASAAAPAAPAAYPAPHATAYPHSAAPAATAAAAPAAAMGRPGVMPHYGGGAAATTPAYVPPAAATATSAAGAYGARTSQHSLVDVRVPSACFFVPVSRMLIRCTACSGCAWSRCWPPGIPATPAATGAPATQPAAPSQRQHGLRARGSFAGTHHPGA